MGINFWIVLQTFIWTSCSWLGTRYIEDEMFFNNWIKFSLKLNLVHVLDFGLGILFSASLSASTSLISFSSVLGLELLGGEISTACLRIYLYLFWSVDILYNLGVNTPNYGQENERKYLACVYREGGIYFNLGTSSWWHILLSKSKR